MRLHVHTSKVECMLYYTRVLHRKMEQKGFLYYFTKILCVPPRFRTHTQTYYENHPHIACISYVYMYSFVNYSIYEYSVQCRFLLNARLVEFNRERGNFYIIENEQVAK